MNIRDDSGTKKGGGVSSLWGKAFRERKRYTPGPYDMVGVLRWRILISEVLNRVSPGAVLKLDAWNEAMGEVFSLTQGVPDDYSTFVMDCSSQILSEVSEDRLVGLVGDIRSIPVRDTSVDCILDISTSDHCPFGEFQQIASEYSRVLGPAGTLLLIHNNARSVTWRIAGWLKHTSPAYGGDPPAYYFEPEKVVKQLRAAGFRVRSRRYSSYFGVLRRVINALPGVPAKWSAWIAAVELKVQAPFSGVLARQHIIEAVKAHPRAGDASLAC